MLLLLVVVVRRRGGRTGRGQVLVTDPVRVSCPWRMVWPSGAVCDAVGLHVNPQALEGKRGSLLKQRDFMKGWRSRYFVLEGKMLSYYKQRTDPLPRGALFLANVRCCRRCCRRCCCVCA